MIIYTKALIFLTILLPLIVTSLLIALVNFGITGVKSYSTQFSSFFLINTNTSNPWIKDSKAGPIINGVWYSLTCAGFLFLSFLFFKPSH